MRKSNYALIALTLFVQFSCGPTHVVVESPAPPPPSPPPAPEVSYQNFYDALSPYGEWINYPEYGYVWMPNVGPDFKPYATNGNWVYTDEGWTWASNYSWGWAPFHYGRWFYEDGYGWMWMPGNEWAPAWVSWRRSPDYYGWAPLGPSVTVNAAVGGGYNPPPHYWCFVPQQYVTSPHVTNYYVNEQQNVTIINNTTVIHNTTIVNNYAGGPEPGEVSRVTGTPLRPIAVRESTTPGGISSGGAFAIYRPRINAAPQGNSGNGGSSFHPAPAHVQTLTNVRPVNSTTYNNSATTNTPVTNTPVTNNNNNFHPNPTPNSTTAVTPATPKPATVLVQGQTVNRPPASGNINANDHPGQPGSSGNPPKSNTQQGRKTPSNKKKPKPVNPDSRP